MFIYTPVVIDDLERSISKDRLSTYMRAVGNDKESALKLYLWNSEISSAFYIPLQGLEVTLRNAIHQAMTAKFKNDSWYDMTPLDNRGKDTVFAAKETVRRNHGTVNPPHVIAELSFGFWITLLNKKYHQTLWIPALGKAFPHARLPRSEIHETLNHIRILRNRIAHHEHIFGRHLAEDYRNIIKVIGWMNPVKADWIDQHNFVGSALGRKPSF
jgi:hypothetical protein